MIRVLTIAAGMLAAACTPIQERPLAVNGLPVVYTESVQTTHARARWHDAPEIAINPVAWSGMTPLQREFALAHELCHLEGGHAGELSADCCAVQRLAQWDVLTASRLATLVEWINAWPSSPHHPPGAERAVTLMRCAP